jgi:diaminopimelate decarboxylase
VLDTVFGQGFGADAASVGEVDSAEARGVPREMIYFSAPARTEAELRAAWGRCVLVADSLREVALIARIAAEKGETAEIGVRINPDFTFSDETGVPSKFGIDEEALWKADLSGVRVVGIHVHAKSQELSVAVLARYYENMFRLVDRVQKRLNVRLRFANFGSGLGIPFAPGETDLDVETLGRQFQLMAATCRTAWPDLQILLESGRYVSGPSGTYVTRVLDKKVSHGKTFLLVHDTLNGFARPAIAQMVRGFTDNPFPCEPLFTHVDATALLPLTDREETETVTIGGNLCTAADIIAKDVTLPRLEVGDGLAMTNAGCYAAVLAPMQFAALTPPAQLFLTAEGRVEPA